MKLININFWQILLNIMKSLVYWIKVILVSGWPFFLIIIIIGLFNFFLSRKRTTSKYQYKLKDLVMTHPEFQFFRLLQTVLQNRYDIFPQIHLDAILDYKINGQSWFGAGQHINQKSVDFLLCDKDSGKLILAIELDDRSHEREDRIMRDAEVERIFKNINLPLLRVKNNHNFTKEEVSKMISDIFDIIQT